MSSITAAITELNGLKSELTRLRLQTRNLNNRKRELEKQIVDFLDAKDQPGLKFQGMAIIPEERETFKAKGKKQKEEDIQRLLRSYGVEQTGEAYQALLRTMKGSPKQSVSLKVKKIKR